jgi:hypothetical protein
MKPLLELTEDDFDAALNAHFPPTRYAPHAGLSYQGRYEEHPSMQPPPAEPCSDFLADPEEEKRLRDEAWWADVRFMLAVSAGTAVLCFLLVLWRGA